MLKSIGGAVAGVLAGAIIIFVVEALGHIIFPPPAGTNVSDPEQLKFIIGQIPVGAKIAVIIAWFAGILGGGIVSLLIAMRWAPVAWVVAATLFAMAGITMLQIPHPWWMVAGAIIATLAGGYGAIKLTKATYARPVPAPKPGL